jgi:CHAT domain-containing protein
LVGEFADDRGGDAVTPNEPISLRHLALVVAVLLMSFDSKSLCAATAPSREELLARAEQWSEQGNLREAAGVLELLVGDGQQAPSADATTRAALLLLTRTYYRSADYRRALEFGARYRRAAPRGTEIPSASLAFDQADFELMVAEAHHRLGQQDEALRCLSRYRAILPANATPTVEQARLAARAAQLEEQIHLVANQAGSAAPPNASRAAPKTPFQDVDAFPREERYRAIEFAVNQRLAASDSGPAAALLDRQLATSQFAPDERVELRMLLADCYRQQAEACQSVGNAPGQQAARRAQRQLLDSLLVEIRHRYQQLQPDSDSQHEQMSRQERAYQYARLLYHLGSIYEQQAKLAREANPASTLGDQSTAAADAGVPAAEQQLRKAVKAYLALGQQADELRRLADELTRQKMGQADRIVLIRQANLCQDWSLCGLQRAYETLRSCSWNDRSEQSDLDDELCRVSEQLVDLRSHLLLPTDMAMYEAERSLAYVYGSVDNHRKSVDEFRKLVAFWDSRSDRDARLHAQALLGLADELRALDQNREARQRARQAETVAKEAPTALQTSAGSNYDLLATQIANSLGIISITLGDYQAALGYLKAADPPAATVDRDAIGLQRNFDERLSETSRAKVYRALLHKAEAEYDQAADGIRQGRELREQLGADLNLVSFHLAEASVHLAKARAMQQEGLATGSEEYDMSLNLAETSLQRARQLIGGDEVDSPIHGTAQRNYRYLEAVLLRLRGDDQRAREILIELCKRCDRADDKKTAGKARMELAILATSGAAITTPGHNNADVLSRVEAEELLREKVEHRSALQSASDYADQAVSDFKNLEAESNDGEKGAVAYPSLHFQASFLAARLHLQLGELGSHIDRLHALLGENLEAASVARLDSHKADLGHPNHQKLAISFLEDAVRQAEVPASSTTHMRAERAKFFTRYAPAYDLLVDLYVNQAVGNGSQADVHSTSPAFRWLYKAIEVADLARNRTFREQIAAWETADHEPPSFQWKEDVAKLSTPGTALLVYHLGGRHLIESSQAAVASDAGTLGGGHLFEILNGGTEIRYFRLLDFVSASGNPPRPLTRVATADYVTHHIDWITGREDNAEWGRRAQREFASTLLPADLLTLLATVNRDTAEATDATPDNIRRIVIVPDGALHQLSFESLLAPMVPGEESLRYLLDILPPIAYGPSLSVLKTLADRRPQKDDAPLSLLTVGDPSYPPLAQQRDVESWRQLLDHLGNTRGFPALMHAQDECDAVYTDYDVVPDARRIKLLQADATEKKVRQYIEHSRIVHIAAHGCVNHVEDNLYGALVFARPEHVTIRDNDGLLQLREIYKLDLSHCDLAVLSACQTNVGAARPLEAGMSMARAFLEQGARSVICSQWSVDDEASAELMKKFFARTAADGQSSVEQDYARALWAAKRAIRNSPKWKASPRYWSPFVLVGL